MESLSREGFRIEFQALNLAIMETIIFLNDFMNENNKLKYMSWGVEDISELRVKDYFFVRDNLLDGLEDENIRPNAFLAYYIYNDFLNEQEWTKVFENALKKLWIDFGLASVDKKSKLFKDNALHNSKSFFFMNNISAISMRRLDKDKFSKYIKDISESSAEEILFSGCIGSCSEFSSYSKLASEGSIVNSLSAATFIELVNEIHQATF